MKKLFCSFVFVFSTIAICVGANPAAAAVVADAPRFAFVDSLGEFLGLENKLAPVFSNSRSPLTGVPVSLPNVSPFQGVVTIPITTGDVTGLGAVSYDLQITFDPAVVTPASPPVDKTGTMSSGMLVTPNSGFPGHLIVTAFQGSSLTGSGTLLYLRFNVIGAPGQSTALAFENFVDPGSNNHPGFRYNEGTPASMTTNGSVLVTSPTPTATSTNTPTNTPTIVSTNTPTNTATSTPTNTATPTFTPTSTATPTPAGTPLGGVPVSMPHLSPFQGLITVPIVTGDVTGLGVISYDLQVTFDPAVVTPASPPFDRTGTLSSSMLVTTNAGFPGHLIITAFQATPLTGSGTLLNLKFNVIGAPGQSTALVFETYTDPSMSTHPGFVFNEGDPASTATNGSVMILATPTPTSTATNTPTPTATETFTPTATNTATFTPTATATSTFTPTATATNTFTPTSTATNTFTPTPTATETNTATPTNTATDTPTATNTATSTPTPTAPPFISGTVTYGNSIGSPDPRFVSNVLLSAAGSPPASAVTDAPGPTAGQYSLNILGSGPYTVTPSKTGGTNAAINSFDAGKIAGHVTGISTLSGNQLVVADVSGNGLVQSFDAGLIARFVTKSGSSGLTGSWRFFTVPNVPFPPGTTPSSRFYATITGDIFGEDYTALLMGEVSGNWNNTGARPVGNGPERTIEVRLPNTVTQTGSELNIPVAVTGVANKEIIAYEFNLRYDPSVIQPMSDAISVGGTASRGLSVVANAAEPGILRVAVYGPMPISEDGILLNLRFKAVGEVGSVSYLIWEKIMFNDGEPQTMATNGQVAISDEN